MEGNNPERRNLLMMSLAFIAFCYGGGSVGEQTVNFQFINLKFENLSLLTWMVWAIFFWFIYRYWVTNEHSKAIYAFNVTLNHNLQERWFTRLIAHSMKRSGIPTNEKNRDRAGTYHVQVGAVTLDETWINWGVRPVRIDWGPFQKSVVFGKYFQQRSAATRVGRYNYSVDHINETGLTHQLAELPWYCTFEMELRCAFTDPGFSEYLVPYILAYLGVLGGVIRIMSG